MRYIFTFLLFFTALQVFSGILILEGKYSGKNLYVQNIKGSAGAGYCVTEIKVNSKITTDEVNTDVIEVDFKVLNLKLGESIKIEVVHKENCLPKMVNPEVVKPNATFETTKIELAGDILKWTTKNENGSLPFIVEQFKWNKWVAVAEIQGDGDAGAHSYQAKVSLHSGANKFRVKQKGANNSVKTTPEAVSNSSIAKPTYTFDTKSISFNAATAYEVYDGYGNVVKKGYGDNFDISNLKKGTYYLCYDNQVDEISKKK
jgi:hypothetical protein